MKNSLHSNEVNLEYNTNFCNRNGCAEARVSRLFRYLRNCVLLNLLYLTKVHTENRFLSIS